MSQPTNRNEELRPDPELAAYLRWLDDLPEQQVDWVALERSIHQRAELHLARRRKQLRRVRLRHHLVPLAAAAGLAAILLMDGLGPENRGPTATPQPTAAAPSPEDVLRADLSEQDFQLLVSGHANPDALLQIAANAD